MFIGTSGILEHESSGKVKEFFIVREIYRERSDGSYLALDVDIKDFDGVREVKLFKSKPVAESPSVRVSYSKKRTTVTREDGTVVIDVEQLEPHDPSLPQSGPVRGMLNTYQLDAVIRITGNFSVGNYQVQATTINIKINGTDISGNLLVGTGGLVLRQTGISFG